MKGNDVIGNTAPFVIAREFEAPRELVWKAWTEPDAMRIWWGPKGSTVVYSKLDLRVGGTHHYRLDFSGHDIWGKLYYREIIKPERMVFVTTFSDEAGGITHHPMSPTWPAQMLTTVSFLEKNGRTTVTVEWIPINATAEELKAFEDNREGMKQGWGGTFDQLTEYLAKE